MNPTVASLLHRIQTTEFFRHSGNDAQFADVRRIKRPEKAEQSMRGRKWQNDKLEMRNLISDKILAAGEHGKVRDRTWNEFTQLMRDQLRPVLVQQLQPAAAVCGLETEGSFLGHVQWDLISVLQEAEFAEFGTIGFYHSLWAWYEAGYLPCGYDGQLVGKTSDSIYLFSETVSLSQAGGQLVVF